jgi:hypothetical protein
MNFGGAVCSSFWFFRCDNLFAKHCRWARWGLHGLTAGLSKIADCSVQLMADLDFVDGVVEISDSDFEFLSPKLIG